jgi:hypothetical protein
MGFDNDHPNRKDWRKAYRKSKVFDRSCRPNGGCPWCESNRRHSSEKREPLPDESPE